MRLFILRHGQTDLNLARKVQGHMDVDLNATGIEQAEDLAKVVREKNLRFDAIYCSPLRRALDTCEIVTGQSRDAFHVDDRIEEFDFGELEGYAYRELPGESQKFFSAPDEFRPAGRGETFPHLIQRITDFLEELKTREQGNVLVASHGTAIHAMLLYFRHKELKPGFPNNHTSLQESRNNYYCFGRASSGLTPRSRYSCSCFVRTSPCTGAFPGSR